MITSVVEILINPIKNHLSCKTEYLNFIALDTGPEEWFRVEILQALSSLTDVHVISTNQKYVSIQGRPDFILEHKNKNYVIELKVLPIDRNYKTSYQRFCSGKSNKADFDDLSNGERHIVIYIHWPSLTDFESTKTDLMKRYSVKCHLQESFDIDKGKCTISFWIKK